MAASSPVIINPPVNSTPYHFQQTVDRIAQVADTDHIIELTRALNASMPRIDQERLAWMEGYLRKANQLHHEDLLKTQNGFQDDIQADANILILIKYPEFTSTTSCRYSSFMTGRVRLTLQQLENAGSELLMGLLHNERHQRRAKKSADPLEAGVTHVIDLSPSYDEEDHTIALQRLSLTEGVKLWYRSMAFGVSPLAVAAHDDVCGCLLPVDEKYPLPAPPTSAYPAEQRAVCLFDTKSWPLDEHYDINDFCPTRWAACTQRLFRSMAKPAGQKDLLIDSAPRMWTLVGLFSKLEMKNYDLLRDEITAWFNADLNYVFVELCPEETLRIGLTLKIPLLSEPAFRILVNERALEVAGGQPRAQPTRTIFGRRCSHFTDDAESIARIIDHAGTAMADRLKAAVDTVFGDDLLDTLDIDEWKRLRTLDEVIPEVSPTDPPLAVRSRYNRLMSEIRHAVRSTVNYIFKDGGALLVHNPACTALSGDSADQTRTYTVPKEELNGEQSFDTIWKESLNQYQRALCPLFWRGFRCVGKDQMKCRFNNDYATSFIREFVRAQREGTILSASVDVDFLSDVPSYFDQLFAHAKKGIVDYADCLADHGPEGEEFKFSITPHLLLTLDDNEMNFLRLTDEEALFQTDIPEADMGPIGPGPAFHTGRSVAAASDMTSDLDFERLTAASDDDDGTTVVGSLAVQDGISTVYGRGRVLALRSAGASSAASSEPFTDEDGMGAEDAAAELAVPAAHLQGRREGLAGIVEEDESDDVDDLAFTYEDESDDATDDDCSNGHDSDDDEDDYELL